jgi:hypothetical protein
MCGLWSGEVLQSLRLRTATFRALCPDRVDAFAGWWRGDPPTDGVTSTFILFDPVERRRSRPWIPMETALRAEARYRGYADAVAAIPEGP